MMADTGATHSCLKTADAQHLPLSATGRMAKTVGFSGQIQLIPFTAPVSIQFEDREATMPILVSDHTPMNLLGRDIMCQLGVQIDCTPRGLTLVTIAAQMVQAVGAKQVYWIGQFGSEWIKHIWEKWGTLIHAHNGNLREPRCPLHCTIMVDDAPSEEREERWWRALGERRQVQLEAQCIFLGPEGVGVQVRLDDKLYREAYDVDGATPHITIQVSIGGRERQVGHMMKRARALPWAERAEEIVEGVREIKGEPFLQIRHCAELTGLPQIVEVVEPHIPERNEVRLTEYTRNCPFDNPYCLHGKYSGVGYRCWDEKFHKPLNREEQGELELQCRTRKWKMMLVSEGTDIHKNQLLKQVPEQVWAAGDFDIGLVKSVNPLEFKLKSGAKLPYQKQYPLSPAATEGIKDTIQGLLQAGVIQEVSESRCNTPIFPVLKADGVRWRMVQDLRPVNEAVEDWPADVPNPHTLLTNIPADAEVFSVIDMTQAFFSLPLAEQCKELFTFRYQGKIFVYNRLPQGFKHSPHIFNQALRNDLKHLRCRSSLLQYVDDLLIASPDVETCEKDTVTVLRTLAEGGHKVSRKKLQFAESQVTYLGRLISQGQKGIAPDQIQAIVTLPRPQTVRQMMAFIGLIGFSSEWVECHEQKIAPLRAMIANAGTGNLKNKLTWTIDGEEAFHRMKGELQQAPALALPDYTKPFCLYVTVKKEEGRDAYMAGILTQAQCTGKSKRAIAYYCTKLDPVAQGYPPCYQGLEAIYTAYEKASSVTMGWPVVIYTSHAVVQLTEQGRFCLTPQRQLKYYDLSFCPDVTIKTCDSVTNPADRIPLEYEGTPHECVAESIAFSKLRPDLESEPLADSEVIYFVDGSSHSYDNRTHAGFSVVEMTAPGEFITIMCTPCRQPTSSQKAEIQSLTSACVLAKGKRATIYTDSAYSHNVCHIYGAQWKQRGFKRADGSPIQHQEQIQLLLSAMMLPKRLAICKCKAHKKGGDFVTLGNARADEVAKEAALQARMMGGETKEGQPHVIAPLLQPTGFMTMPCPTACPYVKGNPSCKWCANYGPEHTHHMEPLCCAMCQRGDCPVCYNKPCEPAKCVSESLMLPVGRGQGRQAQATITLQPTVTIADIVQMQENAAHWEKEMWKQRGAKQDHDKMWRNHEGLMVAPTNLLSLLISDAHDMDHCARGQIKRKIYNEGFWAPNLQDVIDRKIEQCHVCNRFNVKPGLAAKPLGHIPLPAGPFKHVVMDYIDMGKTIRKFRYVLVVVDRFSRWVEACPAPGPDAETVIKFFTREIIPRFGIPEVISSDNGKAFVEKTWKKIMQALGVKQRYGCIYHPQSQGMVERANGTLKAKIAKICASSNLNWLDALPIALMHMRTQTNRSLNLSPHEILTGRSFPSPRYRGEDRGPPLELLQREIRQYVQQLSLVHKTVYAQALRREPLQGPADEVQRPIQPGDWVFVRVFKRSSLQPRREGPFQVTRATPTAVQIRGSNVWYHLNFCCRAPDPSVPSAQPRHDGPPGHPPSTSDGPTPSPGQATQSPGLSGEPGPGDLPPGEGPSGAGSGGTFVPPAPLPPSFLHLHSPSSDPVAVSDGREPPASQHQSSGGLPTDHPWTRRDKTKDSMGNVDIVSSVDGMRNVDVVSNVQTSVKNKKMKSKGGKNAESIRRWLDAQETEGRTGHNMWYRWAEYTAKTTVPGKGCYVCSQAQGDKVVIPVPWRSDDADIEPSNCYGPLKPVSYTPFACMLIAGNRKGRETMKKRQQYLDSDHGQFVLAYTTLLCTQSSGQRKYDTGYQCDKEFVDWPELRQDEVVDYRIGQGFQFECFKQPIKERGAVDVGIFEGECNKTWTWVRRGTHQQGSWNSESDGWWTGERQGAECSQNKQDYPEQAKGDLIMDVYDWWLKLPQEVPLADLWWACGKRRGLTSTLPAKWTGVCTRVTMMQGAKIMTWSSKRKSAKQEKDSRNKRDSPEMRQRVAREVGRMSPPAGSESGELKGKSEITRFEYAGYLDAIGQPRGIPEQYKARNEVKAGFESILPQIAINKNVEWINYIYYNQQRFINHSHDALQALGTQLDATSRMAVQNRMVLDWMLAKEGGVCAKFGSYCCTYIPNNTAPDGAFTKAMIKLRRLRDEVTENAGKNTFESPLTGWFQNAFGFGWGAWAAKVLMGIVLATLAISLIICCLVPVLRSLAVRLVASKLPQMPLVLQFDEDCNMLLRGSQDLLDSYIDSPVIDPVTVMVPTDVGEGDILLWEQSSDTETKASQGKGMMV
ncbi:hypothetical protein ACEWY4_027497 [Coilia grayii]|uniref:Gag-Pol polyprotein n=1 Tax=Coilia grayii TaxID=363190 RepID=A0ABD1IPI2_9TELE